MTRYRSAAHALVLLVFVQAGCGQDDPPGLLEPDVCAGPGEASLTSIEIGSHTEPAFEPWRDGDVVYETIGGQGGSMIGVRHRLVGASVPNCLSQTTRIVRASGETITEDASWALRTYASDDGSRTTRPLWLILTEEEAPSRGEPLVAMTTAAGVTATVEVYFECVDCALP